MSAHVRLWLVHWSLVSVREHSWVPSMSALSARARYGDVMCAHCRLAGDVDIDLEVPVAAPVRDREAFIPKDRRRAPYRLRQSNATIWDHMARYRAAVTNCLLCNACSMNGAMWQHPELELGDCGGMNKAPGSTAQDAPS